jgi:hypothetical protein
MQDRLLRELSLLMLPRTSKFEVSTLPNLKTLLQLILQTEEFEIPLLLQYCNDNFKICTEVRDKVRAFKDYSNF